MSWGEILALIYIFAVIIVFWFFMVRWFIREISKHRSNAMPQDITEQTNDNDGYKKPE